MVNLNHDDQTLLSEQLSLLHKLGSHDEKEPPDDVRHELKVLDTIALLLCTGLPGEHFAVAFDKRVHLEVVLAKNGAITSDDISDAEELFSNLCNPEISTAKHLFPFISRRCRANLVKHIRKLRASIVDTRFYDDFCLELDQRSWANKPLSPSTFELQFPRGTESAKSTAEEYASGTLAALLRQLIDRIVGATIVSEAPDLSEFLGVYKCALALAHCRFLQTWPRLNKPVYGRVQKFQRCAKKLCRYICDVNVLIKDAKRLGGPIRYRWVTDESLGVEMGEGDVHIHPATPLEAVHRASVLSPKRFPGLHLRYPSIGESWQQNVHIRLHAELRIILHFKDVEIDDFYRPIGVSKPSCVCCVLWINEYNMRNTVWWVTTSRCKRDPTWALSACACPNVQEPDLRAIDKVVVSDLSLWFMGEVMYASATEYVNEFFDTVKLV